MRIARAASVLHKWLALIVFVQILFWVSSGLFFTLFPIERIRSEHLVREAAPAPIEMQSLASLGNLLGPNGEAPSKLTIERRAMGQVIVAEFADAPPALYDAQTLNRLSPLSADQARAIVRAHITLDGAPSAVTLQTAETPEYRGALPAWRVQFKHDGLAVYVAQNTGAVTARRSDLWRLYDALWALHIMDWRDHENFNHPLIVTAAALTLICTIAGIVLIPFRIRFAPRRPGGPEG